MKLREMIASHKDLARKLYELEKKYDGQFQIVFEAITAAYGDRGNTPTEDRVPIQGKPGSLQNNVDEI